jgi:hypothetical protein
MSIRISMRKSAIYARRASSRYYSEPEYYLEGSHDDVSSMERAHEMIKAADPDYEETLKLQEEHYVDH